MLAACAACLAMNPCRRRIGKGKIFAVAVMGAPSLQDRRRFPPQEIRHVRHHVGGDDGARRVFFNATFGTRSNRPMRITGKSPLLAAA
jgi:hypothetical protein